MQLPRKYRTLTALIALLGMLFMQLAVASHSCPGGRTSDGEHAGLTSDASMPSMPGCNEPDQGNPALCQAHCQDVKISVDTPQVSPVAHAVAIISSVVTLLDPWMPMALPAFVVDSSLQRIISPPVSIRHCCLRI